MTATLPSKDMALASIPALSSRSIVVRAMDVAHLVNAISSTSADVEI
jgi:hypothetical protein